jgi:hypothetical protein
MAEHYELIHTIDVPFCAQMSIETLPESTEVFRLPIRDTDEEIEAAAQLFAAFHADRQLPAPRYPGPFPGETAYKQSELAMLARNVLREGGVILHFVNPEIQDSEFNIQPFRRALTRTRELRRPFLNF